MNRLLFLSLASAIVLSSALLVGCKKQKNTELETTSISTVQTTTPTNRNKNVIARTYDRVRLPNSLQQIGLAYHLYWDSNGGKGPSSQKDLAPFYENNATINKLLAEGNIIVFYGATLNSMTQGTSNTILAYEKDSDQGMRHVLMADGRAVVMNQADFDKAPKADGK
ncbi:MAG: hypothetical protein ACJ8FY_09920 [Gemmataceae bacterium]